MSLNFEDLVGTVSPELSIDLYVPKAGEEHEVIVVAFFCTEENAADDLNTFIQRGNIEILTSEVSTNTDDDGNYVVFVEMQRSPSFYAQFISLLNDVENVAGKLKWEIETLYTGDSVFSKHDEELKYAIISDSDKYNTWKRSAKKGDGEDMVTESFVEFLNDSHLINCKVTGNSVTMQGNSGTLVAELKDFGNFDKVMANPGLVERYSSHRASEEVLLETILGNFQVIKLGNDLVIANGDKAAILSNSYIKY